MLLIAAVCISAAALNAETPREYPCFQLENAPVLDGNLGDTTWQRIPKARGFCLLKTGAFVAQRETWFQASWMSEALYLAIHCNEPTPGAMKSLAKDGGALWADDSLELFFVPGDDAPCYQLIVNSEGARWNGITGQGKHELWDWQAAAHVSEDAWSLEVRIPFPTLGRPALGTWHFNIARNITTGTDTERHTCWVPDASSFADTAHFAGLMFQAALSNDGALEQAGKETNAAYYSYLKTSCAEASRPACRNALSSAINNPELAKDVAILKKTVDWMQNLSLQGSPNPKHLILAKTRYRTQKRILAEKAATLGLEIEGVTPHIIKKTVRIDLKTRDAEATLLVNGREVTPGADGFRADLREGLNVIAVSAASRGESPGVAITLPDHPETNGRWRVGTPSDDSWFNATFDDRKWNVAPTPDDGMMWTADAERVCFRQLVLWNEAHDGPNRCINPLIKEWGFPENSVENLFVALYSPLPFPLDDFEVIIDLPEGFRLLDKSSAIPRPYNCRPEQTSVETIEHGGQPYCRYRLAFGPKDVRHNIYHTTLLPICLDKRTGNAAGQFFYRRQAQGNFTELEQALPIRKLPPVNGRMPKKVMISQYCSLPWGSGYPVYFTDEHLEMHIKQSLCAGFNYWVLSGRTRTEGHRFEYKQAVIRQLVQGGAHIVMWPVFNHPLYGVRENSLIPDGLLRWLRAHPEAHAHYWQDSRPWEEKSRHGTHAMYCPSYITTAEAGEFWDILKQDYEVLLAAMPETEIIFNDWECWPWVKGGPYGQTVSDGAGSWCFCDRCKKGFRTFAGLPTDEDLSDAAILKNHEEAWVRFRARLYAQINSRIRDICRELGRPYMLYSWSAHQTLWRELKGKIDIAFPGLPGNGEMDAGRQKSVDDWTRNILQQDMGMQRALGQRFSFHVSRSQPDGWKRWAVMSDDGYVHPKSWKNQVLRLVAATHGGIDLQNSAECVGGMLYYIGEATRIISEYEDLFWDGDRADDLAASDQIKYPNLLVLKKGDERLVLLFNESTAPLPVTLQNRDLRPDQKATVYESGTATDTPAQMSVTIPPEDVAVIHIR